MRYILNFNTHIVVAGTVCLLWTVGCSSTGAAKDSASTSDSGSNGSEDTAGNTDTGTGNSSDAGDSASGYSDMGSDDTGEMPVEFDECASVSEGAENTREPADILFVIDNSRSLFDEIEMVRANMNAFSQRIMNSGIDPHIVMVSCLPGDCGNRGGVSYGICIDPPLGAEGGCEYVNDEPDTDDPMEPLTDDSNLPRYKHLSTRVPSMKGLEWLITTYEDNNGLTELGWHDMLRQNAAKHVVVVSDDGDETTATQFDEVFRSLSPYLENYQFHGIFAYGAKDLVETGDPCATYAAPSSPDAEPPILWDSYSALVDMTGGVSGDLCEQDFDPVFEALGSSVIASSKINCEWDIPTPPTGMTMDPALVNVAFSSDTTSEYIVGNIPSVEACAVVNNGWYYDAPAVPKKILVCPDTCDRFQSQTNAKLNIQFGCATQTIAVE